MNEIIDYPKVLVLSVYDYYHGVDASSITIRSLFCGWPKAKLCHIYCGVYERLDGMYSNRLNLDTQNIVFGKIIDRLKNEKDKFIDNSDPNNEVVIVKSSKSQSKIKQKIKMFFSATADMFPYELDIKLRDFILNEKPDVIYLIPSSARTIDLVLKLNKTFSIPVLPHFMDDWPSTIYTDSLFCFLQRQLTLHKLNKLLRISKLNLVISENMKNEYCKRYSGNEFYSIMNSLPEYTANHIKNEKINAKKRFCYSGGLHLNRWAALYDFCTSLVDAKEVEVDIYTNETDWYKLKNKFSEFEFVTYKGFVRPNEVVSVLKIYDYLIYLESFDENIKKYTKFSISTKVPEYLSLGKPIIAVGPSEITSISYLKENDVALVLDENNKPLWNIILSDIIKNPEYFNDKIYNSKLLFEKNHIQKKQQLFFLDILRNIINIQE